MFDENILKEVYSIEGTNQAVVVNQITQEFYLRKNLKIYNKRVYEFLMNNSNLHIPKIYYINENENNLTVYEEYITGKTLEDLLAHESISEKQGLNILYGILEGIDFLHSANPPIIHRDLKPSNIMITNDGVVKIIDYDAAKLQNNDETKDTLLIGTQGFAAPEQYGFSASTVQTDIFAIGKIMEKLLPEEKVYKRIIAIATAMDPKDRFSSVADLGNAVFENFDSTTANTKTFNKKNIFGRIFDKIPGFRSRNPFNMTIAILCDLFILGLVVFGEAKPDDAHHTTTIFIKLYLALNYFMIIDIFFHVTKIFCKMPGSNSKNKIIRFFSKLAFSILFSIVLLIVMVLISTAFPS